MVKRFVEAHITRPGDTEMQEAVDGPWVKYEDYAQLEAALKLAEQALIEVAAAQERGADWYTRGADGLYQIVRRHTLAGLRAIKELNCTHPEDR